MHLADFKPEGTSASGPAAVPPPSPLGGRAAGEEAARHRQRPAEPVSPAGPSAEPGGTPFSALTLPAAEERRAGPSRRHRRHPSRCSSAAGVTAPNGAASASPAAGRSRAATRPAAEAGGRWLPGAGAWAGRPFPGAGLGPRALPPLSRLRPEGRRREGLTDWVRRGLFAAPRLKSERLSSPQPVGAVGTARGTTRKY